MVITVQEIKEMIEEALLNNPRVQEEIRKIKEEHDRANEN